MFSGEARSCRKLCRDSTGLLPQVHQARFKLFAMTISASPQRLILVAALWLWCTALLFYRNDLTSHRIGWFLLWNLLLASVPLVWSAGFKSAIEAKRPAWAALCFGLWLLFLPNAPYILTDLIHLKPQADVPLWVSLALLLSFAGAGTLLGYLSLVTVHRAVEKRFGGISGWLTVGCSLLLCGFGIYVGRFLRWNSWDMMTRPLALLRSLAGQFVDVGPHPHPVPVTLVFGGGLLLGYLALRVISGAMQVAD